MLCAEDSTGLDDMSYALFEDGIMSARGLPDGVEVWQIKTFSMDVMHKILAADADISFYRMYTFHSLSV